MNTIKDKLLFTAKVKRGIREFLESHNYVEADVPVLAPALIPESYLEPFATSLVDAAGTKKQAFLTASPEAFLKRLLCMGLQNNVFYLGKAFRNGEPLGKLHNHEFTLLEWYQLGGDYETLMKETEEMIRFVNTQITNNKIQTTYQLPVTSFTRITIQEAFKKYANTDAFTLDHDTFNKQYVQYVEPHLGFDTPTFLINFPTWSSPLAKAQITNDKLQFAERFELYINGIELVNGWTELTDWEKQQENLQAEMETRNNYHMTPIVPDKGFIEALEIGMPACAGAAMGVDRLTMVLAGAKTLNDVIPFTTSELFY